jgi:hypothetical protein
MTFRRLGARTASVVATLVLAAGAADRAAVVAQQSPANITSLTRAASTAAPRAAPPLDPWERRARLVSLNTGALPNRASAGAAPAAASEISIDLFDGASITAVFDRFDPNDSGVTWVGHAAAYPESRVTLVKGGGVLAASIILPHASYTIRPAPLDPGDPAPASGPVHVMTEINSAGFQSEAPSLIPEIGADALAVAADTLMEDTADFIDVLMVYTGLAETWAGGPAGIINWINLGISETNTAYAASGVNQRVRLAHAQRVAYTEVGNFSTNLNNLRAGTPGLETIAALRNAYTADLVSMFVRPVGADACGIAFIMTNVSTAFAPNGYSVVDAPCSSPNGTLAHEFGHNMGLRHDWFVDRGITPFTYAHGYVNLTARFRTIMAYPDACTSQAISCTRLLAFSNPDLTHLGQPTGVPGGTNTSCPTGNALNMSCDADERRALNDTAFVVANFREFSEFRPPFIRTHPQNQSVPRGQALTLQVVAEGLGPFTYQWYRGSAPTTAQPIAGATGPTYTFIPGADGFWFERWFYWVRVTNAIGPVNSLTATITLLQPGAAPGAPQLSAPQRGIATRDTPRAPAQGSRALPTARPRTSLGVPAAPATPFVAIAQPGTAAPREFLPLPSAGENDNPCAAARIDAVIAWVVLSRRAVQVTAMTDALIELMRAFATLEDSACRHSGGARP